jgi:hypothetical protein
MPYLPPEAIQEALSRMRPQTVAQSQLPMPQFRHPHLRPAAGALAAPCDVVDGKSVAIGMAIALGLGTAGYLIKRAISKS